MDTTSFTFDFPFEVEIPLLGFTELHYQVSVQPEPLYDYCTLSRADVFQGMQFHIESISMNNMPLKICATDQTSQRFYSLIKEAARDHYERRNGSTDFEAVAIHDRVNGQDVTVYDNLQTV